jgi:D-aspartate ligase
LIMETDSGKYHLLSETENSMKEGTTGNSSIAGSGSSALIRRRPEVGVVVIGGNFQGLGILRSLSRQRVPTYLLDKGQCIARFSRCVNRFARCPDVKQEALFLEFLLDLARRENLEGWLVYPNDDEIVCFLAKHKEELEQYYRVTTPSWDIVKYAYDKVLTYELAAKCGVHVPKTYYPDSVEAAAQLDIEYPVILKPSVRDPFFTTTGKKAIRINDKAALVDEYTKAVTAIGPGQVLMVQELIPGRARQLFGVGSLCCHGQVLARVVVRRPRQHPMDFGHATTYAETVDVPELEEMTAKILAAMNYQGLSEVEFMFDQRDGKYKLLEINARPWGWHSIAIGAGVDLPYLSYLNMLGEEIKQDGFIKGVKWFRLVTDIPTSAIELLMGRMRLGDYLHSLRGRKYEAVFSLGDPLPFLVELLMLPYLFSKKGFW